MMKPMQHNPVCNKHIIIASLIIYFKFIDTCTSPSDTAVASNSSSQPLSPQGIHLLHVLLLLQK